MKHGLPVQMKEEYRKNILDADKGYVEKTNVVDGSYTLVSYCDGHQYVKTEQLERA